MGRAGPNKSRSRYAVKSHDGETMELRVSTRCFSTVTLSIVPGPEGSRSLICMALSSSGLTKLHTKVESPGKMSIQSFTDFLTTYIPGYQSRRFKRTASRFLPTSDHTSCHFEAIPNPLLLAQKKVHSLAHKGGRRPGSIDGQPIS